MSRWMSPASIFRMSFGPKADFSRWWTLLVVREAFVGTRRFADFEVNLDISKKALQGLGIGFLDQVFSLLPIPR
jgi:hypothetical protein